MRPACGRQAPGNSTAFIWAVWKGAQLPKIALNVRPFRSINSLAGGLAVLTNDTRNGNLSIEPLLKWPGGKRRLLGFILPLVPRKYNHYYEPFFGSGAVFFALRPNHAVISDRNSQLISAYDQVRDNPGAVIRALQKYRNTESAYYKIRSVTPRNAAAQAARLIYLSTLSFNGIHRVNLKGVFNVPYGQKTHLKPCEPEKIYEVSEALKKARIVCQDFQSVVSRARANDLIYLDPPYTTAHSNNGFLKYNAKIFTWDDQQRLAKMAHILADRGCSVIVSNADHSSIRSLYKDFSVKEIDRFSVIAASRRFRRRIRECVFYNASNIDVE
jgi:DNA adenine methylase